MRYILICLLVFLLASSCDQSKHEQWWPQFRGPEGTGVASDYAKPPVNFEKKNLVWETNLPPGFSSPVIWDNKIFLTGFVEEKNELQTICLNRDNGEIIWQKSIIPDTLEKTHSISNPAQTTVATDGERVVIYFGSCGLFCYNFDGELQWEYPKSSAKFIYGNASSPVINGDNVILIDDEGDERFLLSLDKTTGKEIWKTVFKLDTLLGWSGNATPLIFKDKIIVHRVGEVAAYSRTDGSYIWGYNVLTEASSTPIVAGDEILVNCWYNLSDESDRPELPDYNKLIQRYDTNKNGTISKSEFPETLMLFQRPEISNIEKTSATLKSYFKDLDENGDKEIDLKEWTGILNLLDIFYKPSGLLAINSNSAGQISDSAILWRITRDISEVPTPIYYKGRAYMIKDGGILTCVNPETGKIVYQKRIGNPGACIASPVAANGCLYIFGYNGKLTILKAGDEFSIAGEHNFKESVAATPAIIGTTIYIRSRSKLMAYSD